MPTRCCWTGLVAALALAGVSLADELLQTDALGLRLSRGRIAAVENRLTGEQLTLVPEPKSLAVLWRKRPAYLPADDSVSLDREGDRLTWTLSAPDRTTCTVVQQASPTGSDVIVQQRAASEQAGLYGIHWGLAGVPAERVTLIVPGLSGVAFGARVPFSSQTFSWPSGWEAGMVLLQMQHGGFLIWADDPELTFKSLVVSHRKQRFELRFETDNHAPFDACRDVASVRWRITAYAGDWRTGAAIYRRWMQETFALTPLTGQRPAWVKDIGFMATVGLDPAILDALAEHVVPERTLLYVPNWRKDPYDVNYPDYTAAEGFAAFVEAAHARGFRVMPHVNYFGCDSKHPLYDRFKDAQLRSPHTKELQWWIPPLQRGQDEEPTLKFAYIHPGLTQWRQLLIERFRDVAERYQIDAFHLDQTLCIPNHAGGRVDGLTVPEGNVLLHKELREALPHVALSGEGLDEVTLRYEAFAQRHASHAVDHVHKTWNDAFIACGHPISSFLFLPYNTINGYLGMSNPDDKGVYGGWTRAYENWGVIPTFSRPSMRQLGTPDGEVRALLDLAGLWTQHQLRPDFGGNWHESLKFRHVGDDGAAVTFERMPGGGSVCTAAVEGNRREVYRYIRGVNRIAVGGSIHGWPAHNRNEIMGLDPGVSYFWTPTPRDLRGPHISEMPAGLVVTQTRLDPEKFIVRVEGLHASGWLDLVEQAGDARTGLVLDGEEHELDRGGSFHVTRATCGGRARNGIFAHPPWQGIPGQAAAGLGDTFGEYDIDLPAERQAELCFAIGMRDDVRERSDGVTFSVLVNGRELFSKHWANSAWDEHRVALDAFAGQRVKLRLVTGVGPDGNASFDWAVWGEPRLRLRESKRPARLVLTVPREPSLILDGGAGDVTRLAPAEGMQRLAVDTTLPAHIACLWTEPTRVDATASLAQVTFTVSATVSGQSTRLPLKYVSFAPGAGTSNGEERAGLTAHPPSAGRVYADYLLQLPPTHRLTLDFAVALQDGSKSEACRFLVEANGEELFSQLVTGPDGWHPGRVDLSRFAGHPVLLSLIVDSEGPYSYDWARWADPVLRED